MDAVSEFKRKLFYILGTLGSFPSCSYMGQGFPPKTWPKSKFVCRKYLYNLQQENAQEYSLRRKSSPLLYLDGNVKRS